MFFKNIITIHVYVLIQKIQGSFSHTCSLAKIHRSSVFFSTQEKNASSPLIFQKKREINREKIEIDASVLLSLDVKGSEFVFFNYWKHKTKNFKGKFLWLLLQHQRGGKSAVARALKECAQKKGVLVNFQENQKKCWNLNTISKITCTKKEKKSNFVVRKTHSYIFFSTFWG